MLEFGDKGVYIYKYIVILKNCESYIRCCNRKLVIFFYVYYCIGCSYKNIYD